MCSAIPSRESWADSGWIHPIPPLCHRQGHFPPSQIVPWTLPRMGKPQLFWVKNSLFPNFKIPLFLFLLLDRFWQESLWNFDRHRQGQRWLIVLSTKLTLQKTNPRARKSCKDILDPNTGCWIEDSMQKGQKKNQNSLPLRYSHHPECGKHQSQSCCCCAALGHSQPCPAALYPEHPKITFKGWEGFAPLAKSEINAKAVS